MKDVRPPFLREPFVWCQRQQIGLHAPAPPAAAPDAPCPRSGSFSSLPASTVAPQACSSPVPPTGCNEIGVRFALGADAPPVAPSADARESPAVGRRRGTRPVVRDLGKPGARGAVVDARYRASLQPRAGLARAWFTIAISAASAVLFGTAPRASRHQRSPDLGVAGTQGAGTSEGSARLTCTRSRCKPNCRGCSSWLLVSSSYARPTPHGSSGFDSDCGAHCVGRHGSLSRAAEADRLGSNQRLADAVRSVPGVEHAQVSPDRPLSPARQSPLLAKASGCKASSPRAGSPPMPCGSPLAVISPPRTPRASAVLRSWTKPRLKVLSGPGMRSAR